MLNTGVPILGVDIGGSGMKAALVDVAAGTLVSERHRIKTPKPALPHAMVAVFEQLRMHFDYSGPIGCAFPGVIRRSAMVATAANLDESWVGVNAAEMFSSSQTPSITMVNDADAAGIAEMSAGAGVDQLGTVVMITVGTGLGSAVFRDGVLVPNTEFGHVEINGIGAEIRASARVIDDFGLTFEQWAPRFQAYLEHLELLLSPDLFIIGGGISKEFDSWSHLVAVETRMVAAATKNHAGIIGAAQIAASR